MSSIRARLSITCTQELFFQRVSSRLWKKMQKSGEKGGFRRRKRQLVCDFLFLINIFSSIGLVFHSFDILFCLFHCSPERPGQWSLCKRRLWNCCEVLHRGFKWTPWHEALVHQSCTSDYAFLLFHKKKKPKTNECGLCIGFNKKPTDYGCELNINYD